MMRFTVLLAFFPFLLPAQERTPATTPIIGPPLIQLSTSSGTTAAEQSFVSQEWVTKRVARWKKILRLDDWEIETKIVPKAELKADTLGNIKWDMLRRQATIKVLRPEDYDISAPEIPEDMEYTVVHELVHLHLSVLPRDPLKKEVEEKMVNQLCDAFMSLDKGPLFQARSLRPPAGEKTAPNSAEPAASRTAQK